VNPDRSLQVCRTNEYTVIDIGQLLPAEQAAEPNAFVEKVPPVNQICL
jgi:hypothetical protein